MLPSLHYTLDSLIKVRSIEVHLTESCVERARVVTWVEECAGEVGRAMGAWFFLKRTR